MRWAVGAYCRLISGLGYLVSSVVYSCSQGDHFGCRACSTISLGLTEEKELEGGVVSVSAMFNDYQFQDYVDINRITYSIIPRRRQST